MHIQELLRQQPQNLKVEESPEDDMRIVDYDIAGHHVEVRMSISDPDLEPALSIDGVDDGGGNVLSAFSLAPAGMAVLQEALEFLRGIAERAQ